MSEQELRAEIAKVAPVLSAEMQKLVSTFSDFVDLVADAEHLQRAQSIRLMLDTIVGRIQRTIEFRQLVDAINKVIDLARPEKPQEPQSAEAAPAAKA